MSDLFREVDEEIRHDLYKKLWAQYGNFVIAAAIVIAGGTLIYQGWQSYSKSKREAQSTLFISAVELLDGGAEPDQAVAAFREVAEQSSDGYRLLAELREAALLAQSNKIAEAVAVYDQISVDGSAAPIFQDLARIRAIQALTDSASLSDIKARVASLLSDQNPWRFSARETVALVAYREGNLDEARSGFVSLVLDIQTPPSIKARANEMIAAIGPPDTPVSIEGSPAPSEASEEITSPDAPLVVNEDVQSQNDDESND